MPLNQEITGNHFIDQASFVVRIDDEDSDIPVVTCGPLEGEMAEKKHLESGSPHAWQGTGTITYSNVVMTRGFRFKDQYQTAGDYLDKVDEVFYAWWRAAVNGIQPGVTGTDTLAEDDGDNLEIPSYKRSFSVIPITRSGGGYAFTYRVLGAVPARYNAFNGDANSDDVVIEELEVRVQEIRKQRGNGASGIEYDAFGTA